MKNMKILTVLVVTFFIVFLAGCGGTTSESDRKVIKSAPIGSNLTATLSNDTGKLKNGEQDIYLAFTDSSGKPVDVGAASLNFNMPAMGTMAEMNDPATLTTTSTPGLYKGKVKIEMPGEWQAQISYEGPAGKGKTSFPLTAQ